MFGDLFGGRRGGGRSRARKGDDVRCDVTLDLVEAARGTKKNVSSSGQEVRNVLRHGREAGHDAAGLQLLRRPRPGRPAGRHLARADHVPGLPRRRLGDQGPCRDCRGKGYVAEGVRREVNIPAGVDDGMRIRVPGEGSPARTAAPPAIVTVLSPCGRIRCFSGRDSI